MKLEIIQPDATRPKSAEPVVQLYLEQGMEGTVEVVAKTEIGSHWLLFIIQPDGRIYKTIGVEHAGFQYRGEYRRELL